MYVIRATKKLLDRIKPAALEASPASTTILGPWYATFVFWQPQVALFVNERTLLPVLMPLAPAVTLPRRFPQHLAHMLTMHGVSEDVVGAELEQMRDYQVAKTASRSVLGVMNDFTRLAEAYRGDSTNPPDLPTLAQWLARTPCSPLPSSHTSPDRALATLIEAHAKPSRR